MRDLQNQIVQFGIHVDGDVRTETVCAVFALKLREEGPSMTFRDGDRSIGAFRRAARAIGGGRSEFGNCITCGGIYSQECYPLGFGSTTWRATTGYKEDQEALRELFSRTSNRCTCDPEGDQLFLQNKSKNAPPRPITTSPTLSNTAAELKILDDLLKRGVLTRDQYEVAKGKLTGSYPFSSSATELIRRRAKELLDKFTNGLRR